MSVELVIKPESKDLGEFTVRRVLPSPGHRKVGPFVFFDHMGPAEFPPGKGIAVRPHPHIGLATITYLFEGEIIHRDSLGYVQPIQAGAVNLMTAGRGIVHSERAGEDLDTTSRLHGIQSWMALPEEHEECEPAFVHIPADDLPSFELDGIDVRVIIGSAHGYESPVQVLAPMIYVEYKMPKGNVISLPDAYDERAVYVVTGQVEVGEAALDGGLMAVIATGESVSVKAHEDSHVLLIGGAAMSDRTVWWNFVSSSKERIEQAKDDWRNKRFDAVSGETEFIPLPS
jgi:redox-sensitive bicupin YhaK (pirin superfamily)